MAINQWTQSVTISTNVLKALEHADVYLLDMDGKPFAVLVSIDRYEKQ